MALKSIFVLLLSDTPKDLVSKDSPLFMAKLRFFRDNHWLSTWELTSHQFRFGWSIENRNVASSSVVVSRNRNSAKRGASYKNYLISGILVVGTGFQKGDLRDAPCLPPYHAIFSRNNLQSNFLSFDRSAAAKMNPKELPMTWSGLLICGDGWHGKFLARIMYI